MIADSLRKTAPANAYYGAAGGAGAAKLELSFGSVLKVMETLATLGGSFRNTGSQFKSLVHKTLRSARPA